MCFPTPKTPDIKPAATQAPTVRDANLDALAKRRAALEDQQRSGLLSTNVTGGQGVSAPAPVYKQTLGG